MILLDVDKVNLSFEGVRAIRDLSFRVLENQIVGLIGATESGKTTLFDLISGVHNPDSGKIIFAGNDISRLPVEKINKLGVARTFQNGNIFRDLSVADNIRVGYYNSSKYNIADVVFRRNQFFDVERDLSERVKELLDIFDLLEYENKMAKDIPFNFQRRLDIARAIATGPKLLLLDRPTNGMDSDGAEIFMEVIEMVNRKFKTAVVIIENDINLIMNICDQVSVMEYGTIIATDKPSEVKNNQILLSICFGE